MRYLPILLLLSCGVQLKPHPFTITQYPADPLIAEQAQLVIAAAKVVAPNNEYLEFGGSITISQGDEYGVGRLCFGEGYTGWYGQHISGCGLPGNMELLWPIPGVDPSPVSFALHSALGHELGHIIMGGGTEEQAQAWHLLIQQQYRRDNP